MPERVVLGIGVNVGTFNPGYTVATDGVQFNDTTYDFELAAGRRRRTTARRRPASFNDPAFKNQGDCVSYVNEQSS